jgi:hypothetical protein
MDIIKILIEILDKPNVPKFYRELYKYYQSKSMKNEMDAMLHLIEKKFNKNETNN